MKNNYDENIEFLYRSIVSIDNFEDCKTFFEDICTPSEIQEMSRRLKAAKMLSDGVVYTEIAARTGLSTATISRVNRSLIYGEGGYDIVFSRIPELPEEK